MVWWAEILSLIRKHHKILVSWVLLGILLVTSSSEQQSLVNILRKSCWFWVIHLLVLFHLRFFFAVSDGLMEPFRKYLHTYLSLSGPHLGYLYSTNSLFNSGLWLLEKLKRTQVIHQLTLTDDPDLRQTFFYKLCKVDTKILTFLHRLSFCYSAR